MIYNALLFCWALVILPKVLYFRKKYQNSFLFRLGLKSPNIPPKEAGEFRIWIHAVSLGETKAVIPLIRKMRKDATIFFSSTTETGQKEGRKEFKHCFFLPLDFSWVMRRLVKQIKPDLFILVETDFWYNLLNELDKQGTKIALVNGKVSARSHSRFKKLSFFAKALFKPIDLFCVQSETDQSRFLELGVAQEKLYVTGNIKFDSQPNPASEEGLHFPEGEVVTIALTHENEEELLLNALRKLDLPILLAPRHPERFDQVAKLLKKMEISFRMLSQEGDQKVVLVDRMGVMDNCYAHSVAAIAGGSFVPHVGGHNIYEPARHGIPVLYGPFMHNQESIVNSLKKYHIGEQVALKDLAAKLERLLSNPPPPCSAEVTGATDRCVALLDSIC